MTETKGNPLDLALYWLDKLARRGDNQTHYERCEMYHKKCAIRALARAVVVLETGMTPEQLVEKAKKEADTRQLLRGLSDKQLARLTSGEDPEKVLGGLP